MKNDTHDEHGLATKDFYIASLLRANGIPLINVEKAPTGIFFFTFQLTENDFDQYVKSYWDRTLTVIARDMVDAIYELKVRMKQQS